MLRSCRGLGFDDATRCFVLDWDEHVATFSRSWLEGNAPGRAEVFDDRCARSRTLWRASDLGGRAPCVAWPELTGNLAALRRLMDTGLLVVTDVSTLPGTVLDVARAFGFVRTTNYGDCST